jgi:hypothetical protein
MHRIGNIGHLDVRLLHRVADACIRVSDTVPPPAVEHDLDVPHPRRGAGALGTRGAQLRRGIADALLPAIGVQDKFCGNKAHAEALLTQLRAVVPFESVQAIA